MAAPSPLLTIMIGAARNAARGLKRDFGELENLQVTRKGLGDFVSQADHRAESLLVEELSLARPDYGFLLEERGVVEGADKTHRWIIDPLDGTNNFLHALPQFAISIALERDGALVAGVIYAPITDELFFAEHGQGAFCNNQRLRVSTRNNMEAAMFATGLPRGRHMATNLLAEIERVANTGAAIRRLGSAALDLAYCASGRFDGFWDEGLSAWDVAAGAVLVREAGGAVSDKKGGTDFLTTGEIVAGSGTLYNELLDLVQGR